MRLLTCCFDYASKGDYGRLQRVYRASCEKVMPEVRYEHHELCPPKIKPGYSTGMCSNTLKLRHWVRLVEDATETICLSDCDMLALRSVADADALDFDIAYTVRTNIGRIPFNGGVVFVRPTAECKAFMRRWLKINDDMFHNHVFHEMYRRKYAGMNQAAFGFMYEHPRDKCRMLGLPCAQWNACNEDWPGIPGNGARLVHLKGHLRRALLSDVHIRAVSPQVHYIVGEWRGYGL